MSVESINFVTYRNMLGGYAQFVARLDTIRHSLAVERAGIASLAGAVGWVSNALVDADEVRRTATANQVWCQIIHDVLADHGPGGADPSLIRAALNRTSKDNLDDDRDRDMAVGDRRAGIDYLFRNRVEGLEVELERLRSQPKWSREAKELELELADLLESWEAGSRHPDWGDWRAAAVLGIALAHARTLNAELDMRAHGGYYSPITGEWVTGMDPENTRYFDAQVALGTVYLNEGNRAEIERLAALYGLPPELLAGVVASEMDFDYEFKNRIRDLSDTAGVGPLGGDRLPWIADESQGVGSVHRGTLERAIAYMEHHKLDGWEAAARYPVGDDRYRTSFDGSVEGAAIVSAMYNHLYGGAESPEDMAAVWAGYRGGVRGFGDRENATSGGTFASVEDFQHRAGNAAPWDFPAGANAEMSLALFEFLALQYDRGLHPRRPRDPQTQPPTGTTTTTVPDAGPSDGGPTTTRPGDPATPGRTTTTIPTSTTRATSATTWGGGYGGAGAFGAGIGTLGASWFTGNPQPLLDGPGDPGSGLGIPRGSVDYTDEKADLTAAMDGWGTDEQAIRETLRDATPAERERIREDEALMARLDRELGDEDMAEVDALLDPDRVTLHFDGERLEARDVYGRPVESWDAVSGHLDADGRTQPAEEFTKHRERRFRGLISAQEGGPTPEGRWEVDPDLQQRREDDPEFWEDRRTEAWGDARTIIEPKPWTDKHNRTDMFVHGGDTPGSAGCLDLTDGNDDFQNWLEDQDGPIELVVDYPDYGDDYADGRD